MWAAPGAPAYSPPVSVTPPPSQTASGSGDDSPRASGAVKAGYIDAHGVYQNLSSEEISDLLSLKVTGRPVSTSVASLGEYRVLVSEESETGKIVITGLSMASDNELIRTQLLVEAIIAGIGAVIAATVGRSMVRTSLGPLERVAATAERVASQPLAHGEVRIDERVDDEDLSSSQEVGQVGTALSILLDHVDSALAARQRSETQVRQFVADASHELRTPLASIRGYTELIQREGATSSCLSPPSTPWTGSAPRPCA